MVECVLMEVRVTFKSTKTRHMRGEVGRAFSSLEMGQMSSDLSNVVGSGRNANKKKSSLHPPLSMQQE